MRYNQLLLEAYISNIEQLDRTLEYFANMVDNQYAKQFFTKTLRKQIIRGELPDLLFKIENLEFEQGTEWERAKAAMERGEEVYEFNQELEPVRVEQITHIVHWIKALEEDLNSPDRNIQIRAERALKALPKMKFADAVKASNEYFRAGKRQKTKQAGLEGREVVFETDDFIWVKLTSQEAYEDEGRFLQNCIGRFYRAGDPNNEIYVMKDKKTLDSHVALRIQLTADKKIIQEISGKNNRIPNDTYKPPAKEFLNYLIGKNYKFNINVKGFHYLEEKNVIITTVDDLKEYYDLEEFKIDENLYRFNQKGIKEAIRELYGFDISFYVAPGYDIYLYKDIAFVITDSSIYMSEKEDIKHIKHILVKLLEEDTIYDFHRSKLVKTNGKLYNLYENSDKFFNRIGYFKTDDKDDIEILYHIPEKLKEFKNFNTAIFKKAQSGKDTYFILERVKYMKVTHAFISNIINVGKDRKIPGKRDFNILQKLGLGKIKASKENTIVPGDKRHETLKLLNKPLHRKYGLNRSDIFRHFDLSTEGMQAIDNPASIEYLLLKWDLIENRSNTRYVFYITKKGKKALEKLNNGETITKIEYPEFTKDVHKAELF